MTTELTVIETLDKSKAPAIFESKDAIQELVDRLRNEATSIVFDVSTIGGRKEIASMAHKVAKSKTALDGMGKSLVEGIKQQAKTIDASRKLMRDQLDELKAEVRQPLTDWEDAEQLRVNNLKARILSIECFASSGADRSGDLKAELEKLEQVKIDDSWEEYQAEAAMEKDKAMAALKEQIAAAESREAEKAELERLRREAAEREDAERKAQQERERQEHEALLKAEAEARARAEEREAAERAAKKQRLMVEDERRQREIEKAEEARKIEEAKRQAAEAELRAKQAAEDERRKIAEEKERERQEEERRASDVKHKKKINNESVDDFVEVGLTDADAKIAVTAIAKGLISNIRIQY